MLNMSKSFSSEDGLEAKPTSEEVRHDAFQQQEQVDETFDLTKTAEGNGQAKQQVKGVGIIKHSVEKLKQIYELANILNDNGLHTETKIFAARDFFKEYEVLK